jgi:predicted ATP-grasp superfamily ATP-dependent carboligase
VGKTFIFGSWVCIADGADSFRQHLIDDMKLEASTANQHSDLDKFIDNLDEMLLPNLTREIEEESVSKVTSTQAPQGLLGLDPIRSEEQRT